MQYGFNSSVTVKLKETRFVGHSAKETKTNCWGNKQTKHKYKQHIFCGMGHIFDMKNIFLIYFYTLQVIAWMIKIQRLLNLEFWRILKKKGHMTTKYIHYHHSTSNTFCPKLFHLVTQYNNQTNFRLPTQWQHGDDGSRYWETISVSDSCF